jgi:hypothetical protein
VLRIRIRHYLHGFGSFHHQAIKVRKTSISTFFWLLPFYQTDVNVPSKSKKLLFVDILKLLPKRAGSGSVTLLYGSADPDPYQNVSDPQHWSPEFSPTPPFSPSANTETTATEWYLLLLSLSLSYVKGRGIIKRHLERMWSSFYILVAQEALYRYLICTAGYAGAGPGVILQRF